MWPYPHFTEDEMRCRCGCGGLPKDEFMKLLSVIRKEADFRFVVSSGFRCSAYNAVVAASGAHGPHTTGLAADILISGTSAYELVRLALIHGMTGVGVKQKGSLRFIHLDCIGPGDCLIHRPAIWSY